ncbi:FAD-dependent oxidoreductase [Plantactinospora sp. KBS50]|uniref:FAD-dependent oxidoreductase n=1 Tax=Plantactinospora sp. KBS50 TaxID=2024580 RepID=UPI000BAAA837|nr:FAD-dependent oxidoreductase [Plantactinospora sp. KBS50]ASW55796.1 hypothetical protein CIK06_18850 [Plantactinospora sp. KBS50]
MTDVTVLGSGIVGLWTADILSRNGHQVRVVSHVHPFGSTSAAASAVLVPFLPGDPRSETFQRSLRWADETVAHLLSRDLPDGALSKITCVEFGRKGVVEYSFPVASLTHLTFSEFALLDLSRTISGCDMAVKFDCYLCDSWLVLNWLHTSLSRRGVRFEYRNLTSLVELDDINSNIFVNCLGYQTLFPDDELYPVFGQAMFVPAGGAGPPYYGIGAGEHAVFIHPRGFHIGAFFIPDDAGPSPRRDLHERSRTFLTGPFIEMSAEIGLAAPHVDIDQADWVHSGIRPFRRSGPRVELDLVRGKTVVHNYGHGAHGWTLGYGSSLAAVQLAGLC